MTAMRSMPTPAAAIDRRGALRHPVEVEGVLSSAADERLPVLLTDISERGCQIARPPELIGGEQISLSFAGFAPFGATVVWTSAEAAGLQFDYPAHPALIRQVVAAARGRRRSKRLLAPELVRREERERLWHLRLPVAFQVGTAAAGVAPPIPAILSDLSTEGCRLVADATPLLDATILIAIEGREPITGQVRWRVGEALGVQFLEPLPSELVADIAEQARLAKG
jgi:hypothetical protein